MLDKIIRKAYDNLPNDRKPKPWSFINHGVDLLDNNDDLNCYLAAYGKMHQAKLVTAISKIKDLKEIVSGKYEIIDWGCGQALATICFLDEIKKIKNAKLPKQIKLIEPSIIALERGKNFLNENHNLDSNVFLINKKLDDVVYQEINTTHPITFNFFSNILDITSINLIKLSNLVKKNKTGTHYFICVGPLNSQSTRIDEFAKLLEIDDEQLLDKEKGKLITTRGTIKLLLFKIEGKITEVIKTIYYPAMPKNKNMMHILQKMLNKVNPTALNDKEKVLEYYKTVVELEQRKEPNVDCYHYCDYELINNNEFNVDLETNEGFLEIFNQNKNKQWPKDLMIAIEVLIEDKKYSILNYTYLYDDLQGFNPEEENIQINLTNFEINYSVLSDFKKSEKEIDLLETEIKDAKSLEDIISMFQESLGNKVSFDNKLSFALSSKNSSLSRIYSELRRIKGYHIKDDSLIDCFLQSKRTNNKIDNLEYKDLIQITDLDNSQEDAVLNALNNKITVITGPPGTGKTQVITNIVANAINQNKRVLVSSKNNKAVDNVKDKFKQYNYPEYYLRLGNSSTLQNETIPSIEKMSDLKADLEDCTLEIEHYSERIKELSKVKYDNKQKIKNRDLLVNRLPKLKLEITKTQKELNNLVNLNLNINILYDSVDKQKVESLFKEARRSKNKFELAYSGINKFWINWFSKKKHAYDLVNSIEDYDKDLRKCFDPITQSISEYKNGVEILNAHENRCNIFQSIIDFYEQKEKLTSAYHNKKQHVLKAERYIQEVDENESVIKQKVNDYSKKIIKESVNLLENLVNQKIYNANFSNLLNYKDYLLNNVPTWPVDTVIEFSKVTNEFIDTFNSIFVTSLSAKASLPLENNLFDMVIIDEASQCDLASAIPLILRAKQLVVVGDPQQLRHISSLNRFEDEMIKEHLQITSFKYLNYRDKSLWDYSKDLLLKAYDNNRTTNLLGHYRCHRNIIGFSSQEFYKKDGVYLNINTNHDDFVVQPNGIIWIDVRGKLQSKTVNVNSLEVDETIRIVTDRVLNYPNKTIGVVTPFKDQATAIFNQLPIHLQKNIRVGTVHEFQGDEKDIMIYSLVVTDSTEDNEPAPDSKIYWINKKVRESINVAITRARNTIYIVGNKEYIRDKSNGQTLGRLVNYVEAL